MGVLSRKAILLRVLTIVMLLGGQKTQAADKFRDYILEANKKASELTRSPSFRQMFANGIGGDNSYTLDPNDNTWMDASGQLVPYARSERVYLFISTSVPMTTLQTYQNSLRGVPQEISMVMRGIPGDITTGKEMVEFLQTMFADNTTGVPFPAGVLVDPKLYTKYGIDRVPAVVYDRTPLDYTGEMSLELHKGINESDFAVIYGDVALTYSIDQLSKEFPESDYLRDLAKKIRNHGFYR